MFSDMIDLFILVFVVVMIYFFRNLILHSMSIYLTPLFFLMWPYKFLVNAMRLQKPCLLGKSKAPDGDTVGQRGETARPGPFSSDPRRRIVHW